MIEAIKSIVAKEYLADLPESCTSWAHAYDVVVNHNCVDCCCVETPFVFQERHEFCSFEETVEFMESLFDNIHQEMTSCCTLTCLK